MGRLVAAAGLVTVLVHPRTVVAQAAPLQVVVNSGNSVGPMSSDDLSHIFLKRTLTWPTGLPAVPVDQIQDSPTWTLFTHWIHHQSGSALQAYWQDQIFSGRGSPPVELPSDAEVLEFVRHNLNAVGYVSRSATIIPGVRLLAINR